LYNQKGTKQSRKYEKQRFGYKIEQRQAKWRNFYQASGGMMFVVCDNRSCMRNIRSEINYCLGNKPLVVPLTNLADLQAGKRGEGDRIWLEVKEKVL
jgi:hypothetical protein